MRALDMLRRSLSICLPFVHSKRFAALIAVVEALLKGGRLSATALGRAISDDTSHKHGIKRVDRLLGNWQLHAETVAFFSAISSILLRKLERPVILVDWTEVGDRQVALVAAVPAGGRALPIYCEVHPTSVYANARVERNFARTLKRRVVPARCRPIVISDAGFKNPWFRTILELGWDFVGRARGGVLLIDSKSEPKRKKRRDSWTRATNLHSQATSKPVELGEKTIARSNPIDARLVLFGQPPKGRKGSRKITRKGVHPGSTSYKKYQRRGREPWLLVTSLRTESAAQVVGLYRKRMQIEETFRDAKNHRFGWSFEDARSRSVDRLRVLLLVATLGMLAQTLVGIAAEHRGLHRRYQANTIRRRRVLSLFMLGMLVGTSKADMRALAPRLPGALHHVRALILYDSAPTVLDAGNICGDP